MEPFEQFLEYEKEITEYKLKPLAVSRKDWRPNQ